MRLYSELIGQIEEVRRHDVEAGVGAWVGVASGSELEWPRNKCRSESCFLCSEQIVLMRRHHQDLPRRQIEQGCRHLIDFRRRLVLLHQLGPEYTVPRQARV